MGYIYLKPDVFESNTTYKHNTLLDHVAPEEMKIPYHRNNQLAEHFNQMIYHTNTFKEEQDVSYETIFGNDLDKEGYIIGIELCLDPEAFIEQINRKDFQVIQTQWREKSFHLVAFDHIDSVLQSSNHIYKLNDDEDAFVIVHLEYDEHLVRFDGKPQQPTAYFKALLTARDDIYPIEYLKEPDFVIRNLPKRRK